MKLLAPLSVKSGTVWLRKVIALINTEWDTSVREMCVCHITQNTPCSHTGSSKKMWGGFHQHNNADFRLINSQQTDSLTDSITIRIL